MVIPCVRDCEGLGQHWSVARSEMYLAQKQLT